MSTFNEKMTAIADKIRGLLQIEDLLTLDDMPDKISEVDEQSWLVGYETGYADGEENFYQSGYYEGYQTGISDGLAQGKEAGQKAEYDRFWDSYQDYGKRTSYPNAFSGFAWNDEIYNPKYPINATGNANNIFGVTNITDTKVPLNLGTSTTNKSTLFAYSTKLVTVRELIWDCDINFAAQFTDCNSLKNITFNGTITRNINMQWCPLTGESLLGIVDALEMYRETDDEGKYTITLSASSWADLNAYAEELTAKHNAETGESVTASDYIWSAYSNAQDYVENYLGWLIG